MRHAIYVDDQPPVAIRRAPDVADLGVDEVVLMVESSRLGWSLRWSASMLARYRTALDAVRPGIEISITVWPEPRTEYVRTLVAELPALLAAARSRRVVLDAEPPSWTGRRLRGYRSLDHAELALLVALRQDCAVELVRGSVFAGSPGAAPDGILERCDEYEYQVYGRRQWDKDPEPESEWGDSKSPTGRPDVILPGAIARHGADRLCVALPLWSQLYPGHTAAEAVEGSYHATLGYEPRMISWWVHRHAVTNRLEGVVRKLIAAARSSKC